MIAKVDSADKFRGRGLKIRCICEMEHLDFGGLNNGLQESSEREKLVKIDVTGVKKYVC